MPRIDRIAGLCIGVSFLLITATFLVNMFVRSTFISSPETLQEAVLQLRFGQPPLWSLLGEGVAQPFASRVLFRFLTVGLVRLLGLDLSGLWILFVAFNYVLTLAEALLLFVYAKVVLGLSGRISMLATLFVELSFTTLFAYEYPTYVVEDVLGYCLLLGGLIAFSMRREAWFQAFVILGVLTRETLMILLVPLWLDKSKSGIRKLVATVPALLAYGLPRLLLGHTVYDPIMAGSDWNFSRPMEAVFFLWGVCTLLNRPQDVVYGYGRAKTTHVRY